MYYSFIYRKKSVATQTEMTTEMWLWLWELGTPKRGQSSPKSTPGAPKKMRV